MTGYAKNLNAELIDIYRNWKGCERCPLHRHVQNYVIMEVLTGDGARANVQRADIVIIGEAPGKSEDALGRPFIGRSGRFLRDIMADADMSGLTVVISNLTACRPKDRPGQTDDRPPTTDEVHKCRPRVVSILDAFNPNIVMNLGRAPENYMKGILGRRPEILPYNIMHPAAILRQGGKDSRNYEHYVETFREAFEVARSMQTSNQLATAGA